MKTIITGRTSENDQENRERQEQKWNTSPSAESERENQGVWFVEGKC